MQTLFTEVAQGEGTFILQFWLSRVYPAAHPVQVVFEVQIEQPI